MGHGKPGKSCNFTISFSRSGKSWYLSVHHGNSWKMAENDFSGKNKARNTLNDNHFHIILKLGHRKHKKGLEKVMESHGNLDQKSTNPGPHFTYILKIHQKFSINLWCMKCRRTAKMSEKQGI